MTAIRLRDVVTIRGRFHRSVQLAQDWAQRGGLDGYLLTPTARGIAKQILFGLKSDLGPRAWSITGPYGTGKSAFALFLTDILANRHPIHPESIALRQEVSHRPLLPVLVVGQRARISSAYLTALAESVRGFDTSLYKRIRANLRNEEISDSQIIALTEEAAASARRAKFGGLLLVLDEFGKFLEYVATNPENADLLVIQHLAETAARSPNPIVLITILHSAFTAYLHTANQAQRDEWQKIQGRFTDVAFQPSPEELLLLVGAAIERKWSDQIQSKYSDAVKKVLSSRVFDESRRRLPVEQLLDKSVPLDPITALLLWPVFRSKLAQNERSLFAFLSGHEPFGFQDFVFLAEMNSSSVPFYRIDQFYDYVTTAIGSGVSLGDRGLRWAEIENALNRIPSSAPTSSRAIVKAVGLLSLYGAPVGLRASDETLDLALGNADSVPETIALLVQSSILVYRKHEGAYGLWEGSDIDLDAESEKARQYIGKGNLAARLKQVVNPRPIVARSHYIRTGTMRYFQVDVVDADETLISQKLMEGVYPADGRILFILTSSKIERRKFVDLAKQLTLNRTFEYGIQILAFPRLIVGLEEALAEVEVWNWVRENVQPLQGDAVARQEVRARIFQSSLYLDEVAGNVFGLRGSRFDPTSSEWIANGDVHALGSARQFLRWLSELCDETFQEAPILQNELINREKLSSAAAQARRILLEAMITREEMDILGFEGNPPEVSIYRSLFELGEFHRIRNGRGEFREPGHTWQPVWRAIEQFMRETHNGRRPLVELYAMLKKPPFGLRDGPLPLIFCAFLVVHRDDVGLYEDGLFVPELRTEVLERLVRVPKLFEVQQYRLSDADHRALRATDRVIELLQIDNAGARTVPLVRTTRALVVFAARLPPYVRNTKRLNPPQAIAIRDMLLRAKDPRKLLLDELPLALGIEENDPNWSQELANRLHECLRALQLAYPQLLDYIEEQFRSAFDLQGTSREIGKQLQARAVPLVGYSTDRILNLFVREANRLGDSDWREILARVISEGRQPNQWQDADIVNFQVRLRHLASDFVRLEELVLEQKQTGVSQIFRVGFLNGKFQEARAVVALTPSRAGAVLSLSERLASILEEDEITSEESRKIRIAALARVAIRYLEKGEPIDE